MALIARLRDCLAAIGTQVRLTPQGVFDRMVTADDRKEVARNRVSRNLVSVGGVIGVRWIPDNGSQWRKPWTHGTSFELRMLFAASRLTRQPLGTQ